MPQHADTRQDRAAELGQRWAASAQRHRADEAARRARGKDGLAEISRRAAEKAERLAKQYGQNVERLNIPAARSRTARRLNEDASAEILARAVELAQVTPYPDNLTPKEVRRREREAEKRALVERQAEAAQRARERRAGVDHDPRTAAAQRELVISTRRGADSVASFSDYGSLIARRTDRTIPRIAAMERFDELCHRAYAGLFPEPRFERGVDCTKSLPGVPDDRASSLQEMQRLTGRIGDEAQAILFHRVYQRMTLTWMGGQGMGDPERLGVLFLAAVDAVARFYGIKGQSKAVQGMEAVLQQA